MPSLLVVVFFLQLLIHLVNTVGAPAINNLLWNLYNKLPTSTAGAAREQIRLRAEVVRLKREMNSTSSQDEFAKWAKLRRQHDKALAQYDEKSTSLQAFKTNFDRAVTAIRWIATNGLRFFLQFWYAKRPLFWIPKEWVPGYIEWLLAFPRAPTGSVSIQIWGIACATVIQLVGAAAVAAWVLANNDEEKGRQGVAMKAGGEGKERKKEV